MATEENSFVWICMVFLHGWFGWKGREGKGKEGGVEQWVLHHRHAFVSGMEME